MKVIVEFERSSNAVSATSPDFPNVVALDKDREDALLRFRSLLAEYVAWRAEDGTPLDLPPEDRDLEIIAA